MKRNEKIRAKEIEMQKQAAAKTNAQVNFDEKFWLKETMSSKFIYC